MRLTMVLRVARRIVWVIAAIVALWTVADVERRMVAFDQSAWQQSARGTVAIVELLALFIVTFGIDRVLELWDS